MRPSVNASAGVARNFQDISPPFMGFPNQVEFTSWEYLLSLTQPIYHYDRFIQYRQADERIKQAGTELSAVQQELIVRVAEHYFDILAP
jgi:outer membrane protein